MEARNISVEAGSGACSEVFFSPDPSKEEAASGSPRRKCIEKIWNNPTFEDPDPDIVEAKKQFLVAEFLDFPLRLFTLLEQRKLSALQEAFYKAIPASLKRCKISDFTEGSISDAVDHDLDQLFDLFMSFQCSGGGSDDVLKAHPVPLVPDAKNNPLNMPPTKTADYIFSNERDSPGRPIVINLQKRKPEKSIEELDATTIQHNVSPNYDEWTVRRSDEISVASTSSPLYAARQSVILTAASGCAFHDNEENHS